MSLRDEAIRAMAVSMARNAWGEESLEAQSLESIADESGMSVEQVLFDVASALDGLLDWLEKAIWNGTTVLDEDGESVRVGDFHAMDVLAWLQEGR